MGVKWANDFIDNSSNLPSIVVSESVFNDFHIQFKAVHNNDTVRLSYQRHAVIKISTKFGQILNYRMYQGMISFLGALIINYCLIKNRFGMVILVLFLQHKYHFTSHIT